MIETTIEEVKNNISQIEWDERFKSDRDERLKKYTYSITVEASFLELDTAENWLENNVGLKQDSWDLKFYYKLDYNYGYAELFFKDEKSKKIVKKEIPKFYGVSLSDGKKFRSNGRDQCVDLE